MTFASPRSSKSAPLRCVWSTAVVWAAFGAAGCDSQPAHARPGPVLALSSAAASTAPPSTQHIVLEKVPAPPDVAAPPPDAERTPSGLASKVLTPGSGVEHPAPGDVETIRYVCWRKDGTMYDRTTRAPVGLGLDMLPKGWAEGLALMVAGEKRRLWIPSALAYGNKPTLDSPFAPAGDVVIDVELVALKKRPPGAAASASVPGPFVPHPR